MEKESLAEKFFTYCSMAVLFPLLEMVYFLALFVFIWCWAGPKLRVCMVLYLSNMLFNFDGAPMQEDNPIANFFANSKLNNWMRSMFFWRYPRDYFNGELVKTAELDPAKNHLMCYHPHGIITMGLQMAIGMEGCGFRETFPGEWCSAAGECGGPLQQSSFGPARNCKRKRYSDPPPLPP